jgi:hypothetical protein
LMYTTNLARPGVVTHKSKEALVQEKARQARLKSNRSRTIMQ